MESGYGVNMSCRSRTRYEALYNRCVRQLSALCKHEAHLSRNETRILPKYV
jgi:hypothetical protein